MATAATRITLGLMRTVRLRTWLVGVACLSLLVSTRPAEADFNPRGRQRKPTPKAKPTVPSPPKNTPPTAARPAAQRSPEALIARYTGLVLQQPGAAFPLQRLSELYRERDGNVDALVEDLEQRLEAAPDSLALRLALGWLYAQTSQRARALTMLDEAVRQHPKAPSAALALADLYETDGDATQTQRWLERALPLVQVGPDREQVLRRLRKLALDEKDVEAARKYHEQLVKAAGGSFFVRSELGRELLGRGMNEEAEQELQSVVRQAAGDNRTLAPALRDLAKAQAARQNTEQAIKTLSRALSVTAPQSGLRRELLDVMVAVYRDANRLPDLIALLEREGPGDFARLRLLGSLYEETGRIEDALNVYRRASRADAKDLDVRIKIVRLLELKGELDAAITEYQSLIRADPRNPAYVFQLVELLLQRGERKAALSELHKLSQRSRQDAQTLAAIVDFYERIGESDKSVALLEQVAQLSSSDPQHLIELGGRYFAQGDEERAVQTWKRLLTVVPNRAKGLLLLGEVYLEHDKTEEALEALARAVELEPENYAYKKAYALALERTGAASSKGVRSRRYAEAQATWESLLTASGQHAHLAREARQHIVTLWGLQGSLQDRVKPLERSFERNPPQLAAGRMLAEVYQRLNQPARAERVLRKIVELAPADAGSWTTLERVLVSQRKFADAIEVAERLVGLEPKRAREHYQRLSKYAADLYRDDEALGYASKAVALSPDDATGHKRLGDMYRQRQNTERAIAEYRKALSKNERLFTAYFDLAELLLSQQQVKEADQLLRKVMRTAVDDELIARATRLSSRLHLAQNTLHTLEQELLPLALSQPQKRIYRTLLVELYGSWAFPLIQQVNGSDVEQHTAALASLKKLGQRAVKPLLDALSDSESKQQRVAIELLTHLHNENATLPLFVFATGDGEPELRARAMIAAGSSGGPALSIQLREFLFRNGRPVVDEADPVSLAAVWAITRSESPGLGATALALLETDSPSVQALALMSLSKSKPPGSGEQVLPLLQGDMPPTTRAAAALTLGELGFKRALPALREAALTSERLPRSAALTALARMGDAQLLNLAAQALVSPDELLRVNAAAALGVYVAGTYVPREPAPAWSASHMRVQELLQGQLPSLASADVNSRALVLVESELLAVAPAALVSSDSSATTLVGALLQGGEPSFSPLTDNLAEASSEHRTAAVAAANRLTTALIPEFVVLSSHPNVDVRAAALHLLASRSEPAAMEALALALRSPDESTTRAAMAAVAEHSNPGAARAVIQLLDEETSWPLRRLAAQTLHRLAEASVAHDVRTEAIAKLRQRLERDTNAFVREASLKALVALDPGSAKPMLERIRREDVEARVRQAAKSLFEALP